MPSSSPKASASATARSRCCNRRTWTIAAGELLTVLGPSGSGKTTLLQIICGLVEPTRGGCSIDGNDQTHTPAHRRDIGVVFQNYALFPHLTVAENVAFPLQMRRLPRRELQHKVATALDMVGLSAVQCPLPARAVRRPAAARRAGALPGLPAGADPDGRTARRARPQAARDDADRDQAAAPRNRRDHRLRHARPGGGAGAVRSHLPDEPRPASSRSARRRRSTSIRRTPSSPTSSASPTCCAAGSARAAAGWSRPMASCSIPPAMRGDAVPARTAHWSSGRSMWRLRRAGGDGLAGTVIETVYAGAETRLLVALASGTVHDGPPVRRTVVPRCRRLRSS